MGNAQNDAFGAARVAPLLDHIADGVFVVDQDCFIRAFNPAAEKITGISAEDAVGKTCHEIYAGAETGGDCPVTHQHPCPVRTVFEAGQPRKAAGDSIVTFPTGHKKALRVRAVPLLDAEGEIARVAVVLQDVSELHALRQELEERYEFHNIIGKNHQMQEVYSLIEQIADTDATVTIEGESGTGKELVARAIHFSSRRAKKPFVQVNCSALVETLLESELFGHVRGAFTGAVRDKIGRFEAADGGTIFLDEIGDLSPVVQVKLLRVIQERQFERVGESEPRSSDVRIITATHHNLKSLMEGGVFREDLYYRLRVVPIHLPPLRERREDIPLLVGTFVERFQRTMDKPITRVSDAALARMMDYHWPGNVRELENAIEHAFVRCSGQEIQTEDLPIEVRLGASPDAALGAAAPSIPQHVPALRRTEQDERGMILAALDAARGSKAEAAKKLGIGRTTLWRRMKELDIVWPTYQAVFQNGTLET